MMMMMMMMIPLPTTMAALKVCVCMYISSLSIIIGITNREIDVMYQMNVFNSYDYYLHRNIISFISLLLFHDDDDSDDDDDI